MPSDSPCFDRCDAVPRNHPVTSKAPSLAHRLPTSHSHRSCTSTPLTDVITHHNDVISAGGCGLPALPTCCSCCAVALVIATTHFTPLLRCARMASSAREDRPLLCGPMTSREAPRPRGVRMSRAWF